MPSVFHVSDLHFGHPAVPEQYEALESLVAIKRAGADVIVSYWTRDLPQWL